MLAELVVFNSTQGVVDVSLFVAQDVGEAEELLGRYLMLAELLHPVLERLLCECLFEPANNFLVLAGSLEVRQVTGINVVYLILTAEELHHHCVVLVVLRHADVDPLVVRGAIGVVEGVRNVGARLRIVSAELLSRRYRCQMRRRRQHRGWLQPCRPRPAAGAVAQIAAQIPPASMHAALLSPNA